MFWTIALTCVVTAWQMGCAQVAAVTVRNDTKTSLAVETIYQDPSGPHEKFDLRPQEEHLVVQYEEGRWEQTPPTTFITSIRVRTPDGCMSVLDARLVQQTFVRLPDARRWILQVTPDLLRRLGSCG